MRLNSSLFGLESRVVELVEELNSTVEELTETLDQSINTLEETDAELTSSILDPHEDIVEANQRLSRLEVNGTVAFHVFLHEYTSTPIDSTVRFGQVYMNLGKDMTSLLECLLFPLVVKDCTIFTFTSATNLVSLPVSISEKTVKSDAQQQNLM